MYLLLREKGFSTFLVGVMIARWLSLGLGLGGDFRTGYRTALKPPPLEPEREVEDGDRECVGVRLVGDVPLGIGFLEERFPEE